MELAPAKLFEEEPWLRQRGESERDWTMFQTYLKTPSDQRQSISESLMTNFGISRRELESVAKENNWLSRVTRYDSYHNSLQKQIATRMRGEAGVAMMGLSKDLIAKANAGLKKLEDNQKIPSYRDVVEMIRLAVELNRNGLALQGISGGTDHEINVLGDTPQELINAAIQVNIIKNEIRIDKQPDDTAEPEEIIEGRITGEHGEG